MKLKKLFLLPLGLSVLCFFLFTIFPSTIDENGLLNEPFYLILLGYAFLFFAVILLALTFFKQD